MRRERLDLVVADSGLVASQTEAQGRILAGEVQVDGVVVTKAGVLVRTDVGIALAVPPSRYVSRGGDKLVWALNVFHLDVRGAVALDAGASTGGFTDCLLQHGARLVHALDVGHGQLAWSLRKDPRVRVIERTNIKAVTRALLDPPIDVATVDLAFIGLTKVLHVFVDLLPDGGDLVALVKPHFEAAREHVDRGGVVRKPEIHRQVLLRVGETAHHMGLRPTSVTYSPLRGPAGNIEFFIRLTRSPVPLEAEIPDLSQAVAATVSEAHAHFAESENGSHGGPHA